MTDADETIHLCPYNPNNQRVTKADLERIFKKCGVEISPVSTDAYYECFVHRSYVKKKVLAYSKRGSGTVVLADRPDGCLELQPESNERLEFLGDSILDSVVVSYLFRRFPDGDEGFMTKLKTRLVKTDALARFSNFLGLGEFLIISRHVEEKCEGRTNPRMLEDLFESFIGAMFLDFSEKETDDSRNMGLLYGPGYSVCETFLMQMIEKCIDFEDLIMNDENYKDILLRHFQHAFSITPKYIEMTSNGPAHQRMFTMGVLDPKGNIIGKGSEKSKKKAEQIASRSALLQLGVLKE